MLIHYLIFFVLLLIVGYSQRQSPLFIYFVWGLCLKLLVGVGFTWLFRRVYGSLADSEALFEAGCIVATKLQAAPLRWLDFFLHSNQRQFWDYYSLFKDWSFQTVFSYKIMGLLCWWAGQDFWLVNLYCSFLSAWGCWLCTKIFFELHPIKLPVLVAFMCLPSMVVWSSGILKESLLWWWLGGVVYHTYRLVGLLFPLQLRIAPLSSRCQSVATHLALLLLLIFIIFKLKYYYAVILFAAIVVLGVGLYLHYYRHWAFYQIFFGVSVLFVCLVLVVSPFHQNLRLQYFLVGLVQNYELLTANSDIESLVHYPYFTPDLWGILRNIPKALLVVLCYPLPTATEGNWLKIAAAAENTVLVGCILSSPFFQRISTPQKVVLLAVLLYCFSLAILLALATPNIGTLLRIKVGFMPFLLYIILAHHKFSRYAEKFL